MATRRSARGIVVTPSWVQEAITMAQQRFDFVVVGGGSAGAVLAARLSEDSSCTVALLEAGEHPPAAELMPIACPTLQLNPTTDWMYTADSGRGGLGLAEGRMMVPRGKMLGGCSGINYMAYVRGDPANFDEWAASGAQNWGYEDVLPFFKKSEGLVPNDEIVIDADAHNRSGPLGVAVRSPILDGSRQFVDAAAATGLRVGDYNGHDRGGAAGVVSLLQTNIRDGKRSSTYHAFLEGAPEQRPNLHIITGAHVTGLLLRSSHDELTAYGVEYETSDGEAKSVEAGKEVVLCAGAIGSPQILMLSGIGPRDDLEAVGVACVVDSPHVGAHLKDHLQVALVFPAPGVGVPMTEVGMAMGPDALRAPAGPLPADPADDQFMAEPLKALKREAERQLAEWASTGSGLASSSLYEACAWFSTGLGDDDIQDAQIGFFPCAYSADIWKAILRIDPGEYFDDPTSRLAPDAESMIVLASPVQPRSEGIVALASSSAAVAPDIRMNYFDDPHDLKVMVAIMRRTLEIVSNWPEESTIGPLLVPPALAEAHGHSPGDEPSDALLGDLALHYAWSVYHPTSTCRIGDVVDDRLAVNGVSNLRVADASVMPDIVSGNTNAAAIMIGERAAEMVASDHGLRLAEHVGLEA